MEINNHCEAFKYKNVLRRQATSFGINTCTKANLTWKMRGNVLIINGTGDENIA